MVSLKNIDNPLIIEKQKTDKKHLFPFKYYLCSIFIKSEYTSTKPFFFTKKFILIYNNICKLLDISSYLLMQKEFELLKTYNIMEYFEKNKKNTKVDNPFDINNKRFES